MTESWLLPRHLQQLWLVDSVARDKGLLNIGADVVIEGTFSPEELRAAFATAVGRHDAFRLRFGLGRAGPVCWLLDAPVIRWRVEDLRRCLQAVPDGVHSRIAEAERQPISVEEGSLIRGTLYLLAANSAALAVTAHHLVADAWTIRVLVQDFLHEWRRMRGEVTSASTLPGSVLDILSQPQAGVAADHSEPPLQLPLDRVLGAQDRSGHGDEVVVRLGGSLCQGVRHICGETGQTMFAVLAAALFTHLGRVCSTASVKAGILVTTRDIRRQRKTAGCFVVAAPVAAEITLGVTPVRLVQKMGDLLRSMRTRVQRGSLPAGGRFPVMISMIRDSSTQLAAPAGITVRYERRRRMQAECDLHVFFYDRPEDVEVVLNYDSDVLDAETVTSWANAYVHLIREICNAPHTCIETVEGDTRICSVPAERPTIDCRLQHIALAAWELDIGLRRLAAAGVTRQSQLWEDRDTGVTMALADVPGGIQLEVVAPLRADAPCVGAMERDGEGPYHCCWRVSDVEVLLEAMKHSSVKHTVIRRDGHSKLFPSETIVFVVVEGFGLVEFLHGAGMSVDCCVKARQEALVRLSLESDNMSNARRFLQVVGYEPRTAIKEPGLAEGWVMPGSGHSIHLAPPRTRQPSHISWIEILLPTGATILACPDVGNASSSEAATTWWDRVRIGRRPDLKVATERSGLPRATQSMVPPASSRAQELRGTGGRA